MPAGGIAFVGGPGRAPSDDQVRAFVTDALAARPLDGRSLCVIVPDTTRTCPLPLLLSALHAAVRDRVTRLSVLVALGTHPDPGVHAIEQHLGVGAGPLEATYPGLEVRVHAWWQPETFVEIGTLPAARIAELSGGRLQRDVVVRVNRAVVEHDVVLVLGPVFPHEVVGFSGGNKYLFPGVGEADLIDLTHWLGALISSVDIIGTLGTTPVRALIDEAAALVPTETLALCVVTGAEPGRLCALAFGEPQEAWAAAAAVAAETHIRYLAAPVARVLSLLPTKYDDLWTGAKGFYKVEPVVADGGEVVIYAPHITTISRSHPAIEQIGYHCCDYFVKQWDRFEHLHGADLAHSTHLRGAGTFDPVHGEHPRVQVTLATSIPRDVVESVGLGYLDPAEVDVEGWRRDPSALVVEDAGETLYRLAPGSSVEGRGLG